MGRHSSLAKKEKRRKQKLLRRHKKIDSEPSSEVMETDRNEYIFTLPLTELVMKTFSIGVKIKVH